MRLKYTDYTLQQDILDKLSEELVIGSVSAKDKKTGLYTRANLVHSVTFSKTFILIRLNEGSNLVLNLLEDRVEWGENEVSLNFGDIISKLDLLTIIEKVVLQYLYVEY
jgi:hypothetical protein